METQSKSRHSPKTGCLAISGLKKIHRCSFIYLFSKYLLSIYYMPGSVLGTYKTMNKTQTSQVELIIKALHKWQMVANIYRAFAVCQALC